MRHLPSSLLVLLGVAGLFGNIWAPVLMTVVVAMGCYYELYREADDVGPVCCVFIILALLSWTPYIISFQLPACN